MSANGLSLVPHLQGQGSCHTEARLLSHATPAEGRAVGLRELEMGLSEVEAVVCGVSEENSKIIY